MIKFKTLALAVLAPIAFAVLASAVPAQAQFPHYLEALANLRQARGWLQADGRPQFGDQRHHAIDEINHAIDEVKKAARDDGKNTNWTPPPAGAGDPGAPVHSAFMLLESARKDVAAGQDAPENMGLQVRALQHIDNARSTLREIIQMATGH